MEALSLICHTIAADSWHLCMGLPPLTLPTSRPDRTVPPRVVPTRKTRRQIAMVPTVAPGDAEGSLKALWHREFHEKPIAAGLAPCQPKHVQQALSSVPLEQAMFAQSFEATSSLP